MARIAITEDVEGIRDEEDMGDKKEPSENVDSLMDVDRVAKLQSSTKTQRKFVATSQEVHEAFDSVNTLRFSQPTHLQGI
jgi:cleavage and polyadenylation specificity factor subunit 2